VQVTVYEVDNVFVLAVFHDDDFVDDQILLRLLFQIHLFDRNTSLGPTFECGKDTS
jgi:hypothetical protein